MDISLSTMQYIESVIDTAEMIGIGSVIIEPGRVRGMTDDSEVFILHTTHVPVLEFNAVGINRIGVFRSRYQMVKSLAAVYTATTYTTDTADDGPILFARSIKMQSKKIDLDCRCANPITIRSPKKVLETTQYQLDNVNEWLDTLSKGFQCMSENSVILQLDNGKLSFKLSDENGDALTYIIAEDCEDSVIIDSGAPTYFKFEYHAKVLLPILKKLKQQTICLTSSGMIRANINNFDIFIKPVA